MSKKARTVRQRHCMVVHNYYPLREPRVEREARALVNHGYEVDVICLRGENEPAVDMSEGVRIYRLPVKRHRGKGAAVQLLEYVAFFSLAFAKLTSLHRQRRYRVVQIHNLPDFLVFAGLVPKLTGARVILDIHDVMPEFYASRFRTSMASWPVRLVRWQEQLSCRFADHVITVTDLWRDALVARGVAAHKASVVMNVADTRIFTRSADGERATTSDDFHLFYHGTLTQRYGVDVALRAVAKVRYQIPGIRFTIHGSGEYLPALQQLAAELDLGNYVRFSMQSVPTTDLPRMIQSADVGLVPYQRDVFTDGILPTKLMEYVALAVPVIAARTPAIEAYFDNTMVQFFTPGDVNELAQCIVALYHNRQRLHTYAQNAERFNQRYNWPEVSAGYLALIDQLHSR